MNHILNLALEIKLLELLSKAVLDHYVNGLRICCSCSHNETVNTFLFANFE
jgi:hypothetical protein